ncbi:stereocilin [Heterodontus francisci]|uniref:stereocilin n=1 Tax=Heterodontus francisci TaxID=7792 RepID=UPI00355C2319
MEGLRTLSALPQKNLPSFLTKRTLDSKRLSAFLYNISLYLQNNDLQDPADEGVTLNVLDSGRVEVSSPPRATLELKNLFVSLRASRNLDSLMELLQSTLDFVTEHQLFSWFFQKQNWEVIVGLIETISQTLLSGSFGQASASIQELICSLTTQSDCGINVDWLESLGKLFDQTNWKSVVSFQSYGPPPRNERFRPWTRPPESGSNGNPNPQSLNSENSVNTVQSLLQILSKPSGRRSGSEGVLSANRSQSTWGEEALWGGLEELKQNILRKVGTSVYRNFKRKVSRMTGSLLKEVSSVVGIPQSDHDGKCSVGDLRQLLLWGIRNNISWNTPILGFSSQGFLTETPFLSCSRSGDKVRAMQRNSHKVSKRADEDVKDENDFPSAGILEAVCNDSTPRIPGISNFTVYLYCNLFNQTTAKTQTPPDLRAACSDAAWYFSAIEEDHYWVQVCKQFYTSEFNSTVCSNISLLSQKDFNQPWMLQLCARLQSGSRKVGTFANNCDRLSTIASVGPEDIQRCVLANSIDYIRKLCSNETFLKSVDGNRRLIINLCSQLNGLKMEMIEGDKNGTDYINHFCSQMRLLNNLSVFEPWINGVCSWLSTNSKEANLVNSKCDRIFQGSNIEMDEVQECILHLGVEYIKELCSDGTFLQNLTGSSGWSSLLCTHTIGSLEGLHVSTSKCHRLFEVPSVTIKDLQECIFANSTAHIHNICSNGTSLKVDNMTLSWLIRFCGLLDQVKKELNSLIVGNHPLICDYKTWSYKMFINGSLLESCKDRDSEGLKEIICQNATLYYLISQTHPWIVNYCTASSAPQDEECFVRQLLDRLPIAWSFNTTQLCKNPTAFLMDLLDRFHQCDDQAFSWISNANHILRVFDHILDLSSLERSEEEFQELLSEAILLSSLSDNASFWAAFNPNASISILQTIDSYLKEETNGALKNDLLNCFSPVLWDMLQSEDDSPALKVLFQEYLQMPQENLLKLLMSAESDTVKKLLSHMHRTWHQLQVGTEVFNLLPFQVSQRDEPALETLTAAFLHKFPRVTPDLFVDLSQFIPFMTVSDILSFPVSLLLNDSVLEAIRDHSSNMKPSQKKAFARRLINGNTFGDVESWPPYFLKSVQPLLPYLPICHFQQLTAEQLISVIDLFVNSSLDPSRGRHMIRTILNSSSRLTMGEIRRTLTHDRVQFHPLCYSTLPKFFMHEQEQLRINRLFNSGGHHHSVQPCHASGICILDYSNPLLGELRLPIPDPRSQNPSAVLRVTEGPPLPVPQQEAFGQLICFASQEDLQRLLAVPSHSDVVSSALLGCMNDGTIDTNGGVTHLLATHLRRQNVTALTYQNLEALGRLLPVLGVNFLQNLSAHQRLMVTSRFNSVPFSAAQVHQLVTEIIQDTNITVDLICRLGHLLPGFSPSVLRSVPASVLASACPCFTPFLSQLTTTQKAVALEALRTVGRDEGRQLARFDCLVPFVPLKDLMFDSDSFLRNRSLFRDWTLSLQQAQFIFKKIQEVSNITEHSFLSLGNVARGADCATLQQQTTDSEFLQLVRFLSELHGGIRQSLRKCIVRELGRRPGLLRNNILLMGPEVVADLPLKILNSLSNDSLRAILDHMTRHTTRLLTLLPHKRSFLAEKALQLLGIGPKDDISGEALDNLGPLIAFIDEGMVKQINQPDLLLRLDELKGYCIPEENKNSFGWMLTQSDVLGDASAWTLQQIEYVDRLVFILSPEDIHKLSKEVLTPGLVEMVLRSEGQWGLSDVGRICRKQQSRSAQTILLSKKLSLAMTSIKIIMKKRREGIPNCIDIKAMFPTAWSSSQLAGMADNEFADCVEILTSDQDLSVEHLKILLTKAKHAAAAFNQPTLATVGAEHSGSDAPAVQRSGQAPSGVAVFASAPPERYIGLGGGAVQIQEDEGLNYEDWKHRLFPCILLKILYGSVKSMKPWQVLQLGRAATQLSDRDLQDLDLSDLGILSFLGQIGEWNKKQRKAGLGSFLRRSGRPVSGLEATTLTALGHFICGMSVTEIEKIKPEEFSKAVLFIGHLKLRCTEGQMEALARLTTHSQAFGTVSKWGAEIFTEIGSIAAGLPDIALSSLVEQQIEGLIPLAISLIVPGKFAVVFSLNQLSSFTSAQASAVTTGQYEKLSPEQRRAVSTAQYDGEIQQEQRGLKMRGFKNNFSSHRFARNKSDKTPKRAIVCFSSLRNLSQGPKFTAVDTKTIAARYHRAAFIRDLVRAFSAVTFEPGFAQLGLTE